MKVAMLEPLGICEKDIMAYANEIVKRGHEFVYCGSKIENEEEIIERVSSADVLIVASSPLKGEIIRKGKKLKMISVAFTGLDHIDKETCKAMGITVCNAQGYSTMAVAELAVGLMITLLRRVISCDAAVRAGKTKDGLIGFELFGKTVGVVGAGAIGKRVIQISRAFGCKVLVNNRSYCEEVIRMGAEFADLETVMAESDIISLHVPLDETTRNMIDKDKISLMKPSAILINTSRGPVVDMNALAEALNQEKIAGAGIDVFEVEPPIPADHPLIKAKNVVLTPHVAFATKESLLRRAKIAFENVTAWMDGRPQNVKI